MKSNFSTSISLSANGERSRTIRLFVFLTLFCLLPLKLNAGEDLSFLDSDVTISMDFQDASLKDILKIFSMQSGMNFIASEALQDRKITLFLDKVPVQETMDNLFKANNLSYELDSESNIFIVKDWGKPQTETVTKVFYLKYATVSSSSLKEEMSNQIGVTTTSSTTGSKWKAESDVGITQAVKRLLSSDGSVIEDYRTNSLIVTDIPNRMPVIEKLIASLDVPVPQVMLDVEMLDVSKNVVDKLGFDFSDNPISILIGRAGGSGNRIRGFIGDVTRKAPQAFNSSATGAVAIGGTYAEVLDFLRTQTDTKYLARPRLLTLNNETAEIAITKDEVVTRKNVWITNAAEAGGGHWEQEYERATSLTLTPKGIGISLRVTPQINQESGEITMFIYPQSSSATQSPYITDQVALDPEIKSTKSIVRVKDGETIVLGGLIHHEKTVTIKKLPILGDIPFLGALFRHKNKTKDLERELLVFITPHIIRDTSPGLVSAKKAKLPIREQDTGSALDRQIAINTALNSFKKIK
jgi:type IV pilus assembly protein PilQ